jgi:hypothetical protein
MCLVSSIRTIASLYYDLSERLLNSLDVVLTIFSPPVIAVDIGI